MTSPLPAWHQALAHALTGRTFPELGRQAQPDLTVVADFLRTRWTEVAEEIARPHPLPAELAAGLGPAQLWAAVAELRQRLARPAAAAVTADRPPSPEEQRLLREVPPHHGQ